MHSSNAHNSTGGSASPPLQPLDYFLGLQSLLNALNSARTVEAVADAILSHAAPMMEADAGVVVLLSEDRTMFETLRPPGANAAQQTAWKMFPASAHTPLAVAVNERRIVLFQDKQEFLAEYSEFAAWAGSVEGAVVVIPMLSANRVLGAVWLSYRNPRTYSLWDAAYFETVAAQCAQAIERARLQEEYLRIAQDAAHQSVDALLHGIIDCTTDLIAAVDLEGCFLAFNKAYEAEFLKIFGATIAVGMSLRDALVHLPEEQSHLLDFWRRGLAGEEFTHIAEFGDPDRIRRVYEATCNNLRDREGRRIGAVAVIRDTTKRVEVKQALIKSEARLAEAQAVAQIGSWDYDCTTQEVTWSQELFRLMERDPALGEADYEEQLASFLPEDAARLDAAMQRAVQDGVGYELDLRRATKEGMTRCFHVIGAPITDETGEVVRLVGTCMDITERQQLEAQLRQVQKMDSIGRLAGGIAHDFNNLLAIIMGYAELVAESLPEKDELQDSIQNIQNAATRAANLTQQLLAFAHKQAITPKILQPNEVLTRMTAMLQTLIGEAIELTTRFDPDVGAIHMDANQLDQVIINLVVNARDAMPHGGALILKTEDVTLNEAVPCERVVMPVGRYVCLSISDTGVGMTAEVKERLFEPFFTTKEKGQGTGLGLATVYGIVKQNKGFVWAFSEAGVGTTFKVYLRCADEGIGSNKTGVKYDPDRGGAETVLIAEDEPMLRHLTVTALRNKGYRVLEAANGAEALKIAEQHQGPIHLLMTDAVMPKMGGLELTRRLRQARPDICVLLASGYVEEIFMKTEPLPDGAVFLAKPFTATRLLSQVRSILDARAGGAAADL